VSPTAEQIKHAWKLLEDGSRLDELRASWTVLVRIRHELDDAVVALAARIEQLTVEVKTPARKVKPPVKEKD
jgi:hypothetical protein